jgi:antagonist of KipI
MTSLRVERPGFMTTVQDLGRDGYAHLGVSASGAADALALRIGNLLLGNDEGAAALEMTLVGGSFAFDAPATFVVTGADFGASRAGAPLPNWTPAAITAGARLDFAAARDGARAYLCVQGGIQVPRVLESASAHLLTGVGGRALAAGDVLGIGKPSPGQPRRLLDASWLRELYAPAPIRITPGPQVEQFAPATFDRLTSADYIVREQSNRMGIRLAGPALERITPHQPMVTEGVSLGAIQVPDDGQPIILFVEHQTTGGYPKIANVVSADFHRLGQLRPRDRVRFAAVTFEQAQAERRALEARLAEFGR